LAVSLNNIKYILWFLLVICLWQSISCNDSAEERVNHSDTQNTAYEPIQQIPKEVTFSEHIAPLVHHQCMPCHRSESAGPFDLITYEDVRKRAKMIRAVTASRYMPPWPADADYRHFVGERILTDLEIKLIDTWVEQGSKEGDKSLTPAPPVYPEGSLIGKPDMVVKMEEAHKIKGNNRDNFLMVKVPFELEQDTFIRAIEFRPDNKKLVHHVNGHIIKYAPNKKANIYGGKRIVDIEKYDNTEAFKALDLLNDDGTYPVLKPLVANYLPGVVATMYPDGIGTFSMTKKGAILINDLHYGPSPVDTADQSHFNIFFAAGPPKRKVMETQLGTHGVAPIVPPLVIPPDTVMTFTTELPVSHDISLLTVNPHMHLLGKSFKAYAYTAEKDTIPLVYLPQWDFRWQYFYTFKKMLKIPAGATIKVEAVYDNTTNNPLNPFNPPQTVSERNGSMRTTDEMLQFIINYTTYQSGDENISLDPADY